MLRAMPTLRQLGYGYDVFGNLKRQSLGGGASREDYSYDQLHRLVQSIRSGAASGTVNYGFDAVGNLTKKSDFSSNTSNAYGYTGATCGGGANAVKSVALAAGGTRTYCYDANGNLTSDNAGLSLKYDHQNLLVVAQRGALRDDFRYGADGMRTRNWGSDGARVYLPGYEHRTDTGETKVYIGDYAVISKTGSTRKVEYLLKDRLGSVDAVANSSGAVTETRGYDAFGKPRNGTWNDLSPAKIASTAVTPKGFTQHEHLNELELIHMNGRMYDYNVGRFMGVDPFVQFPLNSQSLNPYRYILNNPLSGTDPTGYTCTPMTGSHVCGADTGAENGQSTSTTTKTVGGIQTTQTTTVYSGGGSITNVTGRVANGASSGQKTTGSEGRQNEAASASEKNATTNSSDAVGSGQTQASSVPGRSDMADRFIGKRNEEESGAFDWLKGKYSELERFGFFYPDELKDPVIIAGMLDMWRDALPHDAARRHEEGAFWGLEQDGSYGLRRWDSRGATRDSINPPNLPKNMMYQGLRVRGEMHVHPNPLVDEFGVTWNLAPSGNDLRGIRAARYEEDSYIIDRAGLMRISPWGDWNAKNRTFVSFTDALGEKP